MRRRRPAARTAYLGFAAFGAFWGTWGAALPAVRDGAGLTDAELGVALLFIGAGALPAMLAGGRAVDRFGHRVTGLPLVLLGALGVAVAAGARDLPTLAAGLTALGAASGAADVGINTAAGAAEEAGDRPVIARSHAVFSAAVVAASLATGLLRGLAVPVVTPFLLVTAAAVTAATVLATAPSAPPAETPAGGTAAPVRGDAPRRWPLLVAGSLGALAFAVENAHQSWSAVYLTDVARAVPAVAAAGPAVFAACMAAGRFTAGAAGRRRPRATLVTGALLAAAGTAIIAAAPAVMPGTPPTGPSGGEPGAMPGGGTPGVAVTLCGLAVAAAGTSVLFPTLLGQATAGVTGRFRGTATSLVSTVSYLGFLAGPPYVGAWAREVRLPGAMLAVAALALVLALLVPVALRRGAAAALPAKARTAAGARTSAG